jgi:threonine dehydratase
MIYFRSTPLLEVHNDVTVVREDLCLVYGHEPGWQAPCLSKTRGIYTHIANRQEETIGVVVTERTLNGWAVAAMCKLLNRKCVVYYPSYVRPRPLPRGVKMATALGAEPIKIQAGRQAVMNAHAAKHLSYRKSAYMMPTALKLSETAQQVEAIADIALEMAPNVRRVIVPTGTGTHLRGIARA